MQRSLSYSLLCPQFTYMIFIQSLSFILESVGTGTEVQHTNLIQINTCAQAHSVNGSNLNRHLEKNNDLYDNKQSYSLSKYLSDMSVE